MKKRLDVGRLRERVCRRLYESAEVKRRVAEDCMNDVLSCAELIAERFSAGGKLLLCGNGGSAADCQHMATEFVGQLSRQLTRPGLPAVALTTDTSFLTAHSNDVKFEEVFSRQVQALGKPGDILIGISTSGNSLSVVRAIETARTMKLHTVALTGCGGRLAHIVDIAICVSSDNTQYVQEAHIAIEHIVCELVESHMFGEE